MMVLAPLGLVNLVCRDVNGPRLTSQLGILDHENLDVSQLARMGGHEDVSDWLKVWSHPIVHSCTRVMALTS